MADALTSSLKMAAPFISPVERDGLSSFSGELGEKIENLLGSLEDDNREQVKKDIIANYTKATLLEFRRKLFSIAVQKEINRREEDATDNVSDERAQQGEQKPTAWGMLSRKTKPGIADDNIDLSQFISNPSGGFPMQIVRRGGKNKSKPQSESSEDESSGDDSNRDLAALDSEETDETTSNSSTPKAQAKKSTGRSVSPESGATKESAADIPVTISRLSDSGTSTDDLYYLVAAETQTEKGMFVDDSTGSDSDSSFNEEITIPNSKTMPKGRSSEKQDVSSASKQDYERMINDLRKRCEKAEQKIDRIENEHKQEIKVLREEQRAINMSMQEIMDRTVNSNGPTCSAEASTMIDPMLSATQQSSVDIMETSQSSEDSFSGMSKDPVYVLTQDSQGVPLFTRATSVHLDEMKGNSSKSRSGRRNEPQPDPRRRGNIPMAEKRPQEGKSSMDAVKTKQNNGSSYMVIMGNSKRWDNKRGSSADRPQKDAETKKQTTRNAKKRRYEPSSTEEDGGPKATSTAKTSSSNALGKDGADSSAEADADLSYSEAVTKYPWKSANKAAKKSAKKKMVTPLEGFDRSKNKDLFLSGLKRNAFKVQKEMEDSIKAYCSERNIKPIYHRVMGFKSGRPSVGCKLVLKESDVKVVFTPDFWPNGISIREWYDKDKDKGLSSNKESDEETS